MPQSTDFPLPANLPEPLDDGAAKHLPGMAMPRLSLSSTAGGLVDLSALTAPTSVFYCYPMTGVPGKPLPDGWDQIPGARGCTPQTCGFRDRHQQLAAVNARLYGVSTQSTEYQREMVRRLNVPFEILSDCEFKLSDALRLPTFDVNQMRLMKRITLIVRAGRIAHVFYPVFPPDKSADAVLDWLKAHPM